MLPKLVSQALLKSRKVFHDECTHECSGLEEKISGPALTAAAYLTQQVKMDPHLHLNDSQEVAAANMAVPSQHVMSSVAPHPQGCSVQRILLRLDRALVFVCLILYHHFIHFTSLQSHLVSGP